MNRKTKGIVAFVVVLVLVGAGTAYRLQRNAAKAVSSKQKMQSEQLQTVSVSTRTVEYGDVSSVAQLTGTIKPAVEVNVVPKLPGRAVRVLADVGDVVKAGQPLLELDQSDLKAQLKQAEAGLAAAQARLAQLKAGARAEEVDQAEAAFAQAKAGLQGAQRGLENARRMYQERTATVQALNAADTQVQVTQAQYESAQALVRQSGVNLKSANDNLQRMTDLYAKGAVTKAQFEGAQAQADIAKAQFQSAQATQEQARVGLEGAKKGLATAKETNDNQTALQAQVDAAESQYRMAEANVKAAQARLTQIKAGARTEDLMAAQAQVAQAEAQVELARSQVENSVVTAPLSGVVSSRAIDRGEFTTPGLPVFTLVSEGQVFVDVSVTEGLVDKVRNGMGVEVAVDAFPGTTFRGSLTNLSPAADPRTRAFPARVRIPNADNRLKAGLFATAKLVTEVHRHVLVVPADSSVERNGDRFVYVVKDGIAAERLVKLGLSDGTTTEVLQGLSAGDRVVVAGQNQLADGVSVTEQSGVK